MKHFTRTLAAILLCAGTAAAQSPTDPDSVHNLPAFQVEGVQQGYRAEMGESALKMDFPIFETPQSIFVINDALIEDQQAFRFDQILQNDSSVQKRNNFLGAYSSHYIRGFSLQNGSNYLRNGRAFFHLASVPVEILQRTEVLKGPSSVLYGTVAPGGMINMVSKNPLPQQVGFVKATIGDDSLYHFHLDTGGPLGADSGLSYRLNLVSEESEYFRSFGNGEAFDVSRQIAYLALDWDITENTTISFNGDVTEDDRPQDIGLISPDGDFSILDLNTIISQPWSHYNSDVWNAKVTVDHRFSENTQLRFGYSFQDYVRDRYDNQLRGFGANAGDVIIRARRRVNRRDYHTYFADLSAKFQQREVSHNFLFGADRTIVDRDDNETIRNQNFVTNLFNPVYIPDPGITTRPEKNIGEEIRDGLFVQDMIEIGEKWRALGGLRYDDYSTKFAVAGNTRTDYNIDNLSPRAGLVFLPETNISLYASYSESFEPNAPVGNGFANAGETLDPTLGKMFEVGAKWELLDQQLLITGAAFTIDRSGATIEDIPTNTLVQTGLQRNNGVEITASGLVNENLTLTGSVTYLDAEFVRDNNAAIVGNRPAGASELAASFWAEYQINSGGLKGLSLQGGWFYESDRPVDNVGTYELDAYHRFDVGLKYAMRISERQGVTFRLTASNVFDETYFKGDSPFAVNVERPREVRFSAQYTF